MHLREYTFILISFLGLTSCDHKKVKKKVNEQQILINYLKKDFRISPEVTEFDSFYVSQLKKENKSLQVDSLISRQLTVVRNELLHLDFVEYYPQFYYKNSENADRFAIYFIYNYKTGKFYFDYIDWNAGYIIEDVCSYYSFNNIIAGNGITKEDARIYNSINSTRRFADWESKTSAKRTGIEAFLNDEFRFKRISKQELDSLFAFYDSKGYNRCNRDTLLKATNDLVEYLAHQVNQIKARYHTPDDLIYLKDQINFLMIRNFSCDSVNNFQWIYENNHRLRERMVSIKESKKSFFNYTVEERDFCF